MQEGMLELRPDASNLPIQQFHRNQKLRIRKENVNVLLRNVDMNSGLLMAILLHLGLMSRVAIVSLLSLPRYDLDNERRVQPSYWTPHKS